MKKLLYLVIALGASLHAFSQAAWIEPEKPDVTQPVRIYCDLSKATAATADAMKADPAGPYYIWTWKPVELRDDSVVNGLGDQAWKNSNERLKMTKDESRGPNVWYYEMIPVNFYGTDANTVYTQGISLLVKPKDGGGYGDPDIKTEDFNIVVIPPSTDRGLLYAIPRTIFSNQITTLVYDNPQETKASMQNLAEGDVYMHITASAEDSAGTKVTIEPSKFFQVDKNPNLAMKKLPDGRFKITMIPDRFFNVPSGYSITELEFTVRRKVYNTVADQADKKTKLPFGCQ